MFWPFNDNDLPEGVCFNHEKINDDECHGNVKNLSDKEAEKIIKKQSLNNLMVCINSEVLPFDFEDHYLKYIDSVN